MSSKKLAAIDLYYDLFEILGNNGLIIALRDINFEKPFRQILKDFTNLTLTGYLELFDTLLAMPYRDLIVYKKLADFNLQSTIITLELLKEADVIPITVNKQLIKIEQLIKEFRCHQ